MATPSLSENVEDIMDSLDDLEAVLEPLLTLGPLADTLGKLGILERAKLQAMLAYVTQDLVFMYLKTQGVDPTKHPVMQQLTEIGKYFRKIKEAEGIEERKPTVDKDAAKRFISAALQGHVPPPISAGVSAQDSAPGGLEAHLKITQKQIDREKRMEESSDEDDDDEELQIVGDTDMDATGPESTNPPPEITTAIPKRRKNMDPFAGYNVPSDSTSSTPKRAKKSKK